MIYHPELDKNDQSLSTPTFPKVDDMVLFASNQCPCLGRVVEIQQHAMRSVVVHVWEQARRNKDFISAKFRPSMSDEQPEQRAITLIQVKLSDLKMSEANFLDSDSRKRAAKLQKFWLNR